MEFTVSTRGFNDIVDITSQISRACEGGGVTNGVASVFVVGSTAALSTIEYEPGAIADLKAALDRMAPMDATYQHKRSLARRKRLRPPSRGADETVLVDSDRRWAAGPGNVAASHPSGLRQPAPQEDHPRAAHPGRWVVPVGRADLYLSTRFGIPLVGTLGRVAGYPQY